MIEPAGPPLNIPVLLGTVRRDRRSERAARWILGLLEETEGVETRLIDLRDLRLPADDAGRAEGFADPDFRSAVAACDGLALVVPEYNSGFPGLLKHALDMLLEEYRRKSAGIVSVSVGGLGGVRMIPTLLPVLRDVGLVVSRRDLPISNVAQSLTEDGRPTDDRLPARAAAFLDELLWLTRTLRAGRHPPTN